MTRRRPSPAAHLRGTAAGLLTAALALAAHSMASGAQPSGAAVALLGVLASTTGAVAATADRASDTRPMLGLLAIGQLVGHLLLATADHCHHGVAGGPPPAVMLAAHITALVVGATLITGADRLCRAVCTTLRSLAREWPRQLASAAAGPAVGSDQPWRSALLLAASVSHRGPPVGLAR